MAIDKTGIKKLKNGNYEYRIKKNINGKKIDKSSRKDAYGNPYTTIQAAKVARDAHLALLRQNEDKNKKREVKLREVWEDYSHAYNYTEKKENSYKREESIWRIHIKGRFGNKYISDIAPGDYTKYIFDRVEGGLSVAYCNSFIKVLGNIYRHALKMKVIDNEFYNEMFINDETKIKEKKKSYDEKLDELDEGIETFNSEEISEINKVLKGTNLYIAFLFGYFCGLRVGETFGLMWEDYDWEKHTIKINKQMVYSKVRNCMTITTPKTDTSYRTIDVPKTLHDELLKFYNKHEELRQKSNYRRNAREIIIDIRRDKEVEIEGGDFINRANDGKLLTINSVKYWADKIKKENDIYFKYHSLRRTHLTQLADMGTPPIELMKRAGHTKYETTLRYYIGEQTGETKQILLNNINELSLKEEYVEVEMNGFKIKMKQSDYKNYEEQMKSIPH